jgi:hypothetical protein
MPDDKQPINPKVHAGALGAVGGYSIGKGIAVVVMHYVVGATPPEVAFAIEFLIEATVSAAGSWLAGYIKVA